MAAPELAGVPVLILREGASRSRGREAQRANIMAAKIVAESARAHTFNYRGLSLCQSYLTSLSTS